MPYGLSIAGKAMAYMAIGKIRQDILQSYHEIFSRLIRQVEGAVMDIDIAAIITHRFTLTVKEMAAANSYGDEDMLTTFQEFLRELLVQKLLETVDRCPEGYSRNLSMAGGCALNIKWNSAIRNTLAFREIWVPPFPNDAGSAIGTACCEMLATEERRSLKWNVYSGPVIGRYQPGILEDAANDYLAATCTVDILAWILHIYNEPVAFLNGAAELGPRALGNRSILAPASSPAMKVRLNDMKNREDYRPVAPICLEEYASGIFTPGTPDPFMLFEHIVKVEWRQKIPAICHLDNTARLQTVNAAQNEKIHRLLTAYHQLSGIPLLCNTSANLNGSGFFPDIDSAMKWGKASLIWSDDTLYIKKDFIHSHELYRKVHHRSADSAYM